MRKLAEQILILEGIERLRRELRQAYAMGESSMVIDDIMTRLTTMYTQIDPICLIMASGTQLKDMVRRAA